MGGVNYSFTKRSLHDEGSDEGPNAEKECELVHTLSNKNAPTTENCCNQTVLYIEERRSD